MGGGKSVSCVLDHIESVRVREGEHVVDGDRVTREMDGHQHPGPKTLGELGDDR